MATTFHQGVTMGQILHGCATTTKRHCVERYNISQSAGWPLSMSKLLPGGVSEQVLKMPHGSTSFAFDGFNCRTGATIALRRQLLPLDDCFRRFSSLVFRIWLVRLHRCSKTARSRFVWGWRRQVKKKVQAISDRLFSLILPSSNDPKKDGLYLFVASLIAPQSLRRWTTF